MLDSQSLKAPPTANVTRNVEGEATVIHALGANVEKEGCH